MARSLTSSLSDSDLLADSARRAGAFTAPRDGRVAGISQPAGAEHLRGSELRRRAGRRARFHDDEVAARHLVREARRRLLRVDRRRISELPRVRVDGHPVRGLRLVLARHPRPTGHGARNVQPREHERLRPRAADSVLATAARPARADDRALLATPREDVFTDRVTTRAEPSFTTRCAAAARGALARALAAFAPPFAAASARAARAAIA
jgi:hypothetical protein